MCVEIGRFEEVSVAPLAARIGGSGITAGGIRCVHGGAEVEIEVVLIPEVPAAWVTTDSGASVFG